MDTNQFEVYGCYGTMTVEVRTGKVLGYEPLLADEPEYADIARFDIPTYVTAYGLDISPGDHVCIMDLAFWSHEGWYFDPGVLARHSDEARKREWLQPDIVYHSSAIQDPKT